MHTNKFPKREKQRLSEEKESSVFAQSVLVEGRRRFVEKTFSVFVVRRRTSSKKNFYRTRSNSLVLVVGKFDPETEESVVETSVDRCSVNQQRVTAEEFDSLSRDVLGKDLKETRILTSLPSN